MAAKHQLSPVKGKLVVFDHMVAKKTQTLVLQEKTIDDFDIERLDGSTFMRGEGKFLSWHGRKLLYDSAGRHVLTILKKRLRVHTTFDIQDRTGQEVMQVKSSLKRESCLLAEQQFLVCNTNTHAVFGSKASATFTTSNGTPVTFVMKGNWLDTFAEIVDEVTGAVVARIDRNLFNKGEVMFGHQRYNLTIAPGADIALLVAMCICFDEKNNGKRVPF